MTLIAGFVCLDGFVIAGDTEVALGDSIRVQETKLVGSPGEDRFCRLILGGAGSGDYLDEVMQEIRDRVSVLGKPVILQVDGVIRKAVNRIHDNNIFKHWVPGDPYRPGVELIVGLRDAKGQRCVWKTRDKAVSKVNGRAFAGTGAIIAAHVSEKLFRDGLATAIVHHIATQILREAKVKGALVGGNTDTWSVQTKGALPYFDIPFADRRYLWGLEDTFLSAVRGALVGRGDPVKKRLDFIVQRISELQKASRMPLEAQGDQWHTVEIIRADLHPFGDS